MENAFKSPFAHNKSAEEKESAIKKVLKSAALSGMMGVTSVASAESGVHPDAVPAQESHRLTLSTPESDQLSIEKSTEALRHKTNAAKLRLYLDRQVQDVINEVKMNQTGTLPPDTFKSVDDYQAYFTEYQKRSEDHFGGMQFNMPITPDNVYEVARQITEGVGMVEAFNSVRDELNRFIIGDYTKETASGDESDSLLSKNNSSLWKQTGQTMLSVTVEHLKYRATEQVRSKIIRSLINSGRVELGSTNAFSIDSRNAKNMYFQKTWENKSGGSVTLGADIDPLDSKTNPRAGIIFEQKF